MTDLELLVRRHSLSDGAAKRPQHLKTDWSLVKDIRKSVTSIENILLQEFKDWIQRKRFHQDRYQTTMRVLLANLWNTHLHDRELIVSAGMAGEAKTHYGYSPSIGQEIISFLAETEYIGYQVGRPNSYSGVASWCVAGPRLINLIDSCEKRIIASAHPLGVILRDVKQEGQRTGDDVLLKGRNEIHAKKKGAVAVAMNNLLARSDILCPTGNPARPLAQTPIVLTRIFNNKSWSLGGRYYGDHQGLSAAARRDILINGESVVELDYAALHLRMIYAESGIQFPLDQDPYGEVGSAERKANKLIILKMFNASDEASLKSSITRSGDVSVIELREKYRRQYQCYLAGTRGKPVKPTCLRGFIDGMPIGTRGDVALKNLYRAHPIIEKAFVNHHGHLGLYLQYKDSEIMTRVLATLLVEKVPVLPVHDSVIVPASKRRLAYDAMAESFSAEYPGITIPICDA